MAWQIVASCDYKGCQQGGGRTPSTETVRAEGEAPETWFQVHPPYEEILLFCSASCLAEYAGELPARPVRPHA